MIARLLVTALLQRHAEWSLDQADPTTVRDLVIRSEDQLLEVRNFGETTLAEVQQKLRDLNLHLGMRVPSAAASF